MCPPYQTCALTATFMWALNGIMAPEMRGLTLVQQQNEHVHSSYRHSACQLISQMTMIELLIRLEIIKSLESILFFRFTVSKNIGIGLL